MTETTAKPNFPLALIVSSFVNKCGNLGLALLPMLLIEKNFPVGTSSLIMGATKAAGPIAIFFSGNVIGYVGSMTALISSFLLSALALGLLPFMSQGIFLGLAAVGANVANNIYNPAVRTLIKESSTPKQLTITLAWLRSASNLGQVVSSVLTILAGTMGLAIFFLFDSATSLAAALIGKFFIPKTNFTKGAPSLAQDAQSSATPGYYAYAVIMAVNYLIYELGMLSFSALSKIHFGDEGIKAFGMAMFINTFLCGIFAVVAAKYLTNAKLWTMLGFILIFAGALLFIILPKSFPLLALCTLLLTLGEIVTAVFTQPLLLHHCGGKLGQIHYGRGLTIQKLGSLLAGVILFPIIIHGAFPWAPFVLAFGTFFILLYYLPDNFFAKAPRAI